jgi:hypothetical protein
VSLSSTRFTLSAGEEAIISENASPNQRDDGIGRRRSEELRVADGRYLLRSEISLPSLLAKDHMVGLLNRSRDRVQRGIFARILKTAACLTVVTASHGRFNSSVHLDGKHDNGLSES